VSVSAIVAGTVVTPGDSRQADVLIGNGRITAIEDAGTAGTSPGQQRIDASGCYVLPGGVDPHCHLMADIGLATAAAACGGTTTALSFTNPGPREADLDCLLRRRAELSAGQAVVDVGLHAMLHNPQQVTESDLVAARRAGAAAVKVFLAYSELGIMCSTRDLFGLMSMSRRVGLIVQVHCENGPLIEALMADALASGRHGARVFTDTRPPEVEEEAVARTLSVASLTDATCCLVHLSSAPALEQVRLARTRRPLKVIAEVCLHHLLLDDSNYARPDLGKYLVAPPLRSPRHVEALWRGIADGTLDTVGSDHCQTRAATIRGLSGSGESYEYGLAGIGARLPMLLSAGLARGIPMGRLVQLVAENPARIFGHYPRKGALLPGSDADVVVFDPAGETVVRGDSFDDGTGPSVYAGHRLRGRIRAVLLGGRLIVADGQLVDQPRGGRYLSAAGPTAATATRR
jgi:dihydropyrimidinase